MLEERIYAAIDSVVPRDVKFIGFVASDALNRVAVLRHWAYGTNRVTATFIAGERVLFEGPAETLVRAVVQYARAMPVTVYPLGQVWHTRFGKSYYFTGLIDEFAGLRADAGFHTSWMDRETARELIICGDFDDVVERNLAILDMTHFMTIDPSRNVLEMLRVLHTRGFERLRVRCHITGSAKWNCTIYADNTHTRTYPTRGSVQFQYSSTQGQRLFDVDGVEFMPASELASAFITLYPELAAAGAGGDAPYLAWLSKTLDILAPIGVFYKYSEYEPPKDALYTRMAQVRSVPDFAPS